VAESPQSKNGLILKFGYDLLRIGADPGALVDEPLPTALQVLPLRQILNPSNQLRNVMSTASGRGLYVLGQCIHHPGLDIFVYWVVVPIPRARKQLVKHPFPRIARARLLQAMTASVQAKQKRGGNCERGRPCCVVNAGARGE
jgi:hypothetical protein